MEMITCTAGRILIGLWCHTIYLLPHKTRLFGSHQQDKILLLVGFYRWSNLKDGNSNGFVILYPIEIGEIDLLASHLPRLSDMDPSFRYQQPPWGIDPLVNGHESWRKRRIAQAVGSSRLHVRDKGIPIPKNHCYISINRRLHFFC